MGINQLIVHGVVFQIIKILMVHHCLHQSDATSPITLHVAPLFFLVHIVRHTQTLPEL